MRFLFVEIFRENIRLRTPASLCVTSKTTKKYPAKRGCIYILRAHPLTVCVKPIFQDDEVPQPLSLELYGSCTHIQVVPA